MTKSYISRKSTLWKRALVGGLLSAGVASACFGFLIQNPRFGVRGIPFFLLLGFGYPGLLLGQYASNIIIFLAVVLFWFLAGALIRYLVGKDIVVVGIWLIVYAISFLLSLAWFAEMNN